MANENKKNIDAQIKRVEEIAKQLSDSEITLEDAINLYDEAKKIIGEVDKKLENIKKDIESK